jgi:uncharacterized caspase-like protein
MKYALIIGNDKYDDAKLAQLKTPAADSQALAKILGDETIGSFDEVTPLLNQTESSVRRAISTFLTKKKPDDLVLLYFSGHGVLDDRGRLYLALKDTQVDLLKATSIPSSFVADEMDSCRSKRQILILDCCHSGAFARGTKGEQKAITETTFEGSGFGRVVLTASDSTQYALEGDQIIKQTELSLFTHFLLEGLKTGEADTNMDGLISLDEWYEYTYGKVVSETPRQVPHKWSYNQSGDLIIARNPYLKKKAAELPSELLHALESSFVGIRESAVNELGNYLRSNDPQLAHLAVASLRKMKGDDSRRISSLAEKLLSEFELLSIPAPAAISIDNVVPESAVSTATIRSREETTSTIPENAPAIQRSVDSSFWWKWIGIAVLAILASAQFYSYHISVEGASAAVLAVLFAMIAGASSLLQRFLVPNRFTMWWVVGNLGAAIVLGLLQKFLFDRYDWWEREDLGLLLLFWGMANFIGGLIYVQNGREDPQNISPVVKFKTNANRMDIETRENIFFVSLSLSILLFSLMVFSDRFGLTGTADILMVLLGIANVLVCALFFLKNDMPRNIGFIALAISSLLFGIFIELELFTSSFKLSLYTIPALLSLLSGIFFATQKEMQRDLRFLLLSAFLILLGISHIGRDTSVIYGIFSIPTALVGLVTAILLFRGK